jgi:hypothetical protein
MLYLLLFEKKEKKQRWKREKQPRGFFQDKHTLVLCHARISPAVTCN